MANIPSYNQIDYENDDLSVIEAKKKAIAKQEAAERERQAKTINIPSYNQIDYENDDLLVIEAKKKAIAKQEAAERAKQAKSATSSMESKTGETNELAKEFKEVSKQHKIENAGTDPNAQDGKNNSAVQEKAQEMDDQAKTISGSLSGAGAKKKKKTKLLDKAKKAIDKKKEKISSKAASKIMSKLSEHLGNNALKIVAQTAGTTVLTQGLVKGINSILNGQKTIGSKKTPKGNKTATSADGLKKVKKEDLESIPKSVVFANNTIGARTKK